MRTPLQLLLIAAAAVVLGLSVARVAVFWPLEAYLDNGSGSWTALAADLARGVFYRPVVGPDGYGGTRFLPLHFSLHAGLILLLGDAIRAGYFMSGLSVALLCASVYTVLTVLGVSRLVAISCAAFVLASQTAQEALLSIRGDALAAALNISGVAACVGIRNGRRRTPVAAILFTLAFATKATAVSGLGASVLWLWLIGRRRESAALLGASAAGIALVFLVLDLASGGVALTVLRTSGGTWGIREVLRAPLVFAGLLRQVPETLVFVQLGLATWLATVLAGHSEREPAWHQPAWLLFAFTLLVSVPIFIFDGADTNHLIDLHGASLIGIGAWLGYRPAREEAFGAALLSIAALGGSVSLATGLMDARTEQRWGTLTEALEMIGTGESPVLAENALVPIARGERPYVNDAYMFRIIRQRDPSFGEPLWRALREQRFAAVVLERDPHTERGIDWYRYANFGEGFVDELERTYEIVGRVKNRVVYRPRAKPGTGQSQHDQSAKGSGLRAQGSGPSPLRRRFRGHAVVLTRVSHTCGPLAGRDSLGWP